MLLHQLAPVGEAHIALLHERLMHAEGCTQVVAGMTLGGVVQIIPQQLAVVGVCTVLDDGLGTLHGTLAAEVGDTLLGDENVDAMLVVVDMRYHGHDGADGTVLGCRGA